MRDSFVCLNALKVLEVTAVFPKAYLSRVGIAQLFEEYASLPALPLLIFGKFRSRESLMRHLGDTVSNPMANLPTDLGKYEGGWL